MSRKLGLVFALLVALLSVANQAVGQCAMCRTQLENNVSNGEVGIAAGINTGILYLLSMPYLCILVIGYFWYKSSKKNANSRIHKGITTG
jgi:hypothetical protein